MVKGYGRKTRLKLSTCQFTDEVTDLLARRIRQMPQYKDCKVNSRGPFGLGATCSVSVKKGDKLLGFLTVGYEPSENGFGSFNYLDYNAPEKHTYPKGSIGDMNHLNIQTRKLPTELSEVIELVFAM